MTEPRSSLPPLYLFCRLLEGLAQREASPWGGGHNDFPHEQEKEESEKEKRNPWMDEARREVEGEEKQRERERGVEMKNSLEPKVTTGPPTYR